MRTIIRNDSNPLVIVSETVNNIVSKVGTYTSPVLKVTQVDGVIQKEAISVRSDSIINTSRIEDMTDVVDDVKEDGSVLVYDVTINKFVLKKLSTNNITSLDGGIF